MDGSEFDRSAAPLRRGQDSTLGSMRRTLALLACLAPTALFAADFTLTILHTNDVHARVEPNKIKQSTYGGYPRNTTLIKQFMKSDPNPILLSAGDVFQGTLYFNVYEGLADLAFMNRLGYTAMVVGNHEFDKGPKAIGNFARLANFPLLRTSPSLPPILTWRRSPSSRTGSSRRSSRRSVVRRSASSE